MLLIQSIFNMSRPLITFILIFILVGCETQVPFELPVIEPKLVINSVFSADSLFKINITASKPNNSKDFYLQQKFDYVQNAEIFVTQNNVLYSDFEYKENGFYVSKSFIPKTESKCELKVSAKGYKTVQAQSSIPYKIKIDSFYYSYISHPDIGDNILKINLIWNDPPDENYYYILASLKHTTKAYAKKSPDIFLRNHPIFGDWSLRTSKNLLVFNDNTFNGKKYNFEFFVGNRNNTFGSNTYTFYLCHISKNFYQWAESIGRYFEQNSFFDEPVVVYNNIEDGIGVFAGYNMSSDSLSFNGF